MKLDFFSLKSNSFYLKKRSSLFGKNTLTWNEHFFLAIDDNMSCLTLKSFFKETFFQQKIAIKWHIRKTHKKNWIGKFFLWRITVWTDVIKYPTNVKFKLYNCNTVDYKKKINSVNIFRLQLNLKFYPISKYGNLIFK